MTKRKRSRLVTALHDGVMQTHELVEWSKIRKIAYSKLMYRHVRWLLGKLNTDELLYNGDLNPNVHAGDKRMVKPKIKHTQVHEFNCRPERLIGFWLRRQHLDHCEIR